MSAPRLRPLLTILLIGGGVAQPARAQPITLSIKRTFASDVVAGCSSTVSAIASLPRDAAEARRVYASGQEMALQGDPRGAGVAFARASALDPADDRIAYAFARVLEEANDSSSAVREYCRAIRLSPAGRDLADVRARITRLTPPASSDALRRARERFSTGVVAFDARRYEEARRAFDDAARALPQEPEARFNRAVAESQLGDRSAARREFTTYLALRPEATDRALVQRSIDALGRPQFAAGTAFASGLVPGVGQFYTRRPAKGLAVLALVGGAAYAAMHTVSRSLTVAYVDPNGVPAPYLVIVKERPYRSAGLAAGAGITIAAALESAWFAKRGPVQFQIAPGGKGAGLALRF
ncbi:tetratricopeptide repeat protein [Gemmatimonas sp.]|uniref:tetratricopeptide repeat protein n=1 Tax=Gemmatimonas sp. TaxID=1962908 RepID=UPI00286C8B8E|nr:tetratricopeptide repeat protein [Gemmatimonas sp.]